MIEAETKIFQLIFPPEGAVPLDRLDKVPLIRNHIASIIDLANGNEQRYLNADESAAITAKIVELRDTPGPDGLAPTWETIAALCNTSKGGARKRYATYKNKQTFDRLRERQRVKEGTVGESSPRNPPVTEQPETPAEPAQKTEEPPTVRESQAVEKTGSLSPETLVEVDRMLAEGVGVQEISRELGRRGMSVPWTKVRARAAYLARVKGKGNAEMPGETSTEQHKLVETSPLQEAGSEQIESATEQEQKPEPVSISRAELDRRMWDMWKAGKTLDEISDILYSEGLYYSAKSVRVRLLNQGAKL